MENNQQRVANREVVIKAANGWPMLGLLLLLGAASIASIPYGAVENQPVVMVGAAIVLALTVVLLTGLFSLQPNEARVLVLFGSYQGTVRESGLHWANPFYSNGGLSGFSGTGTQAVMNAMRNTRNKISLRARTLNGDRLKVNDKGGNPIEIAAVVVWRVEDTAQAKFDVDNYETYVTTQSESALRHLANLYCYTTVGKKTKLRCAAMWMRSRRHCGWNWKNGWRRRVCEWMRHA